MASIIKAKSVVFLYGIIWNMFAVISLKAVRFVKFIPCIVLKLEATLLRGIFRLVALATPLTYKLITREAYAFSFPWYTALMVSFI